ncbi:uncharacterized protein [Argopecten irradians]
MSAGWREPSGSVPKELHNRPKYLVQHIREATVRCSDITSDMVTMVTEKEFLVQSSNRQSHFYRINLGDESSHTMPSCDCRAFKKTHFPCKHFCALICHINNITWNSLPNFYMNNPHFIIDEDCVKLPKDQLFNIQEVEHSTTACAPCKDLDNTITEPQQPQGPSLSDSARKVREILKDLYNLTYIADSVQAMEEARKHLSSAAEQLREGCPVNGSLLIENIPPKRPSKKRKLSTEPLLKKLPTRAKRKRTIKHQFQRISVNDEAPRPLCKKSNKRKRTNILSEKMTVIEVRQEMEKNNDKSNNSESSPKSSRSEVLKRIKDMIREMLEETWMALLQTARRTASYSYDIETRKAQAVLDECCDEDDHHDFIKEISELAPETFNIHERLRLSFLLLCLLDPEQSPSDVTLPEPLLSVSPSLKSTSKLKLKKEKRIRFNLPSDGDKKEMENILFWTCLLLLVYRTDVCKADTAHKPKEVLVIGGGISGLAAARKLVNHPSQMFDVTVLEARKERYGGRVWTNRKLFKKPLGAETDLGAVWINSKVKDNPILAIARKGELETKVSGPIQLHVPEADKIFKGDEANKIFTEVFSIMQSAVDKVKATGVDIPLQKAVEDEISGHTFQGDRAIITSILRNHNAVSKPDYSTMHFDPAKQFGWNTIVVDGYDQVLDA